MKSAQWLAVVVLALMVGGITFVTVYLGGRGDDDQTPTAAPPRLTFPVKMYPQSGQMPISTEVHQPGHQDYWFINDSGKDVNVGLDSKGCTCLEVEVTLAPERWKARFFGEAAGNALLPAQPGLINSLAVVAATQDYDHVFPDLPGYEGTTTVLGRDNSILVPADALGRVRLNWLQKDVKPLLTFAELWIGQRGGDVRTRLEAGVKISAPLELERDITAPSVDIRDLEKMKDGQQVAILCWSLTRRSFQIAARPINDRGSTEADPIEVGQPIPLTHEEMKQLEGPNTMMLPVLSGYRIPVTVRARAKDGTPIDWGFFRRYVELSSPDEGIESVQVRISGQVRGDVVVGGGRAAGIINLGPFSRKSVARGTILLRTDDEKLDLRLDSARVPRYLKARLDSGEKLPSGSRVWKLHVEVPPRSARGEFPRADNPDYRDSAIYVTTVEEQSGQTPRTIRIPVMGVANEG